MDIKTKKYGKYSLIALLLLSLIVGSTAALTITALTAEKISIFGGVVANSNFVITSLSTKMSGHNKIIETVTIKNIDTSAHATNVDTQILDSSGNNLVCTTPSGDCSIITASGSVAAGASLVLTFTFTGTNIVSSYSNAQIDLTDTA